MDEEEEWPETWDRNKVYMYKDPDGNKVPVPHGFTVSGAESEKYVNHNVEMRGTLEELTLTPGEKTWEHDESDTDKAWKLNEDGVWVSQNKTILNSEAELSSNEFTVGQNGGYLSINWSVNSWGKNDLLFIQITNCQTGESDSSMHIEGRDLGRSYKELTYIQHNKELDPGKYSIKIKYSKHNETNWYTELDCGYIKNVTLLDYSNAGTDIINIHKFGGLVIYEGTETISDDNAWQESQNRNQFVWIPVENLNRISKSNSSGKLSGRLWNSSISGRTELTKGYAEPHIALKYTSIRSFAKFNTLHGYQSDLFSKDLIAEFNSCINSIRKYGGFYIGRYETSCLNPTTLVIRRFNDVQIKPDSILSNLYVYSLYENAKNISANSNINIGIIWGSLFDETIEWIVQSGEKTIYETSISSANWGNYGKYSGVALKLPGSSEKYKANNIYDLAGNALEITLEHNLTYYSYVCRGGFCYSYPNPSYNNKVVVSERSGSYEPTANNRLATTSRCFFYIK